MATPTAVPTDDIDGLLERYLRLLDEYTKLRSTLANLQTSVYQNIARANFSAERGIRYGQEMYDERMQASRVLSITTGEDATPKFEIVSPVNMEKDAGGDAKGGTHGAANANAGVAETEKVDDEAEAQEQKLKEKPRDPLRWFGILTPMPLRHAQSASIQVVADVVPKLMTIEAEMADVEIRVRRARKKRAKAEAAAAKRQGVQDEKSGAGAEAAALEQGDAEVITERLAALGVEGEARSEGVTA